jgi:hypothetical protein
MHDERRFEQRDRQPNQVKLRLQQVAVHYEAPCCKNGTLKYCHCRIKYGENLLDIEEAST